MNKVPLVSVIIPTYNRANTIYNSVNSVLKQTYNNIEIIIVDDCSTDNTKVVIDSIKDPRIKYIKLEKNSGPARARNAGVGFAKGDYISFHDSDDLCHADKIEKQLSFLINNPDVDLCFCKMTRYRNKIFVNYVPTLAASDFNANPTQFLLYSNYIGAPAIMVKKGFFEMIGGFNTQMPNLEDWDLGLKASLKGKIAYMDEALLDVNISDTSITYKPDYQLLSVIELIKNYLKYIPPRDRSKYILHMFKFFSLDSFEPNERDYFYKIITKELYPNYIKDLLFFDYYKLNLNTRSQTQEVEKLIRYKKVCHLLLDVDNYIEKRLIEQGIRKIAIYGMGKIGKCLADRLKYSGVTIICGIDLNTEMHYKDLETLSLDDFNKRDLNVDKIIITPIYSYAAIKEKFISAYRDKCISIEDLEN